jgi:putative transposase
LNHIFQALTPPPARKFAPITKFVGLITQKMRYSEEEHRLDLGNVLGDPHGDKSLSNVPDDVWSNACRYERVIRELIQKPIVYGARTETMAAAAAELQIDVKSLYRLTRAYKADPRTRTLLPKPPGPQSGFRRLDPRVEAIIEDEIKTRYLALLKPTKTALMRGIWARCKTEGLTQPARETVMLRLGVISKRDQIKSREGRGSR